MSLQVLTAAGYLVLALAVIVIGGGRLWRRVEKETWPRLRRHGFRIYDLEKAFFLGFLMLVFNAVLHALAILRWTVPWWIDLAGTTSILVVACLSVLGHRKTSGWSSWRRRTTVYLAPVFAAMSLDHYLAKLAGVAKHLVG